MGDDGGSYIEDKVTKERIFIEEEGGMYALKMWVRKDGLHKDAPFYRHEQGRRPE